MARIYIACARVRAERARAMAKALTIAGHEVLNRWFLGFGPVDLPDDAADLEMIANADEEDLFRAEYVIVLTELDKDKRIGGCEDIADAGMAQGVGIPIVWSSERDARPPLAFHRESVTPVTRDEHVVPVLGAILAGKRPRPMRQLAMHVAEEND